MSAWSGLAAGGIGALLILVAAGMPIWDVKIDDASVQEDWSYRPFSAYHYLFNKGTLTVDDDRNYSYSELASIQRRMSRALMSYQQYLVLGVLAAVAGVTLSLLTYWKKLRGSFAGIAFGGASASILFASFEILFSIPAAAGDINSNITGLSGRMSDNSLVWGPQMGLFLPIGAGLAFAWAASDVWHLRPKPKSLPMRVTVTQKVAPASRLAGVPPTTSGTRTAVVREPLIEEVFLIGSNGLLIKHMARSLMTDKDRDVVGSMISAISSFVREAFSERDGEVHEVRLGDHQFVMCNEGGIVIAVLVAAGEAEVIVPRLRHLLAVLRDRYGKRLIGWSGEALEGIEDELRIIWEPYRLPPPPVD